MATVNLGRIKPVFRGAYSGSTAYVVDDIVTHGNESFICIQAHGAGTQATSQTAYWTKLAAKGADGTDVGTTITTQGDILYRDGSGLQRLAAGTSGYFLKTQGSGANPVWAEVGGKIKNYKYSWSVATQTYNYNNGRTVIAGHNLDFGSALSGTSLIWLTGHQEYSFDTGDPGNALRWEYSADNSTWYGDKYLSISGSSSTHAGDDAKSNWTGCVFFNTTANNDSSMVHSSLSAIIPVSSLTVAPRYFRVTGRQTDQSNNNIKVNHCSGGGYNPMGGSSFNVFELGA